MHNLDTTQTSWENVGSRSLFSSSDGWKGPGQHRGAEYNQKSSDTAENHHSLMITWLPSGDPELCLRSNSRYLDANFPSAEGD
ncbi:uncharacterized [Tachysurus ichikawai]